MQNVPKIVRDRLRAAPAAGRSDAHPDADLLTAFAERSLAEFERAAVLDHLARCGDCREVVALALPASPSEAMSEPVVTAGRQSSRGWLTWPALRWGFVAAAVVAVASVGMLRYQHQPATVAVQKSVRVEVAANEPKQPAMDRFAAPPPTEKEKLQSPAAPVLTDAVSGSVSAIETNAKKSAPQGEASPSRTVSRPSGIGIASGRNSGAGFGAQSAFGPRVASQSQVQNAQNQAPVPAPPSAYSRQSAGGDAAASAGVPAASETVTAASAAPVVSTEAQDLDARQGKDLSIDRAKALVPSLPSASGSAVATINPTNQAGAASGLGWQAAPGKMLGYVFDPSGAVVANARITITPSNRGKSATAVTDSQGSWLIAGLPTGDYKAQAEAPGFRTTVQNLNYDANQPSTYRFTLNVGSVAETVEVTGENAAVQTESASIGGPINGRNFGRLIARSPDLMPSWTISASGGLQRSLDQGKTWQAVDVNANSPTFAYEGNSETSLQITAKTSGAKQSKDEKDSGKLHKQAASLSFRAVAAAGSDVWAGGTGGALYHSQDAGNHWIRIVPGSPGATLTGDVISLDFPDPQHGKVSTSTSEVWTTADSGQTWQKQ